MEHTLFEMVVTFSFIEETDEGVPYIKSVTHRFDIESEGFRQKSILDRILEDKNIVHHDVLTP